MTRPHVLSACVIFGLVVGVAPASAQSPGSFEIHANPDRVPPGVPVRLTGSLPDDGRGESPAVVTITVTPPKDGPPEMPPTFELRAPVGKDGAFDVELTQTGRLGRYKLEARSPGGRFTANGTFDTVPLTLLAEETAREHEALARDLTRLVDTLEELARNLPPIEARDRVVKGVWPLKMAIKNDGPGILVIIGPIIESPIYHRRMAQWQQASSKTRRAVGAFELALKDRCEAIEQLIEGFNLASAMFNLLGTPLEIAANFAKDKLASYSSEFLIQQAVKRGQNLVKLRAVTDAAKRQADGLKLVPGAIFDLGAFVGSAVFDHYCTTLSGDFSGGLKAKFSRDDRTWWTYDQLIGGRLYLRYPKGVPAGQVVPVRGEFIGSGFGYEADWNRIAVVAPRLITSTGSLYLHATFPPVGMPPSAMPFEEGKAVAALLPNAFFVVVEGEMIGRDVTLRLGPSRTDFEVAAKAFYLLMSPITMSIDMDILDLPYKNGRTILSRSFHDGPMTLRLERQTDSDVAEVARSVKKEGKTDGDLAEGWYDLRFKVCAGGCK